LILSPLVGAQSVLTAVEDRRGNRITLERTTIGGISLVQRIVAPNGEAVSLQYDANNRIIKLIDHAARETQYTYDAQGMLASITNPAGETERFLYDTTGRLTSRIDARGITVVVKEYDANGRVIRETFPDGGVTHYQYVLSRSAPGDPPTTDASSDIVLATIVTDPVGSATTYRFDVQGRLTDVTDGLGNTVSYAYDPATGRVVSRVGAAHCETCGAGEGQFEGNVWDALGRRVSYTDAVGGTTSLTYVGDRNEPSSATDATGRTTLFEYDEHGDLVLVTSPGGAETLYERDSAGRVVMITEATGRFIRFIYGTDGRLAAISNTLTGPTTYKRSDSGAINEVILPDGSSKHVVLDSLDRIVRSEVSPGVTVHYEYEPGGRLGRFIDPSGTATVYAYDANGRRISETRSGSVPRTFKFDVAGNLSEYTKRTGEVTRYHRDLLSRLTRIEYADNTFETQTWDRDGNVASLVGRDGATIIRHYDAMGRMTSETNARGSYNYTFDAIGRRVNRIGPGGTLTFGYSQAGFLRRVSYGNFVAEFDNDPAGRRTVARLPNNTLGEFAYDEIGRETTIAFSTANWNESRGYSYDSLNRVSKISAPSLQAPDIGDQTSATDNNGRIESDNGQTIVYDAEGRVRSDGVYSYVWDAKGDLVERDGPVGVDRFVYDAIRRRTRVEYRGVPVTYLYDRLQIARIANQSRSTDLVTTDVPFEVLGAVSSGDSSIYLQDRLRSVIAVASNDGSLARYGYDDCGLSLVPPIPGENPIVSYAGLEQDAAGLVKTQHRYLDVRKGRWLSEEPVGHSRGEWNLYRYAANDPVNLLDTNGKFTDLIVFGVLIGLAVGFWALQRHLTPAPDRGDLGSEGANVGVGVLPGSDITSPMMAPLDPNVGNAFIQRIKDKERLDKLNDQLSLEEDGSLRQQEEQRKKKEQEKKKKKDENKNECNGDTGN